MRYFKCFNCSHIWTLVFWDDGKDSKMACPHCKSLKVHRINKVRGWDRVGKYSTIAEDDGQLSAEPIDESEGEVLLIKES